MTQQPRRTQELEYWRRSCIRLPGLVDVSGNCCVGVVVGRLAGCVRRIRRWSPSQAHGSFDDPAVLAEFALGHHAFAGDPELDASVVGARNVGLADKHTTNVASGREGAAGIAGAKMILVVPHVLRRYGFSPFAVSLAR
jgi:hypothetical protein